MRPRNPHTSMEVHLCGTVNRTSTSPWQIQFAANSGFSAAPTAARQQERPTQRDPRSSAAAALSATRRSAVQPLWADPPSQTVFSPPANICQCTDYRYAAKSCTDHHKAVLVNTQGTKPLALGRSCDKVEKETVFMFTCKSCSHMLLKTAHHTDTAVPVPAMSPCRFAMPGDVQSWEETMCT